MTGPKVRLDVMDRNKKQKTATHVWRPISTQASSIEECSLKDGTVESEDSGQLRQVYYSACSSISDAEQPIEVVEAVTEVTDSTIISSTLDNNVQDRALEGESVLSVEKHSLSVQVGASLIRLIKGKGGSTQQKLEEDMGVKIIFPTSKKEESIFIEGSSIDSVTRASEKIQAIIDEVVESRSLDYSHFISLPLAIHPELVDKLINFQNSILGNSNASLDETMETDSNEDTDDEDKDQDIDLGIDKSIFIKPQTFHLTVLMLKLWNKERVLAASEVLESISSKVMDALDNRPIFVRLKGLDCMRGSMARARVLYATIQEIGSEDRLLRACQVITDAFVEAGLVLEKDAKQKLKLHATVMNASHRKGKRRMKQKYNSFDARGIFKLYGSEEWGEYLIREAHLSQRFVFDENGYYHCCASIPFPEAMQTD